MAFKAATRTRARARVAIDGPAKAGKSFTSLRLAFQLGKKVAAIDTEFGSLSKYAGESPDGVPFAFDVDELTTFSPAHYEGAIRSASKAGYDVLVIDSLSHAWVGQGGILDQKDQSSEKNQFTAWGKLTPQHRRLVDAILAAPLHVVVTMRSKTEYVLEDVDENGRRKQVPRKVGLAPVQREGMEYEFDLLCSMDADHWATVTGSRCPAIDGAKAHKPGAAFFAPYVEWLGVGGEPPPAPRADPSAEPPGMAAKTPAAPPVAAALTSSAAGDRTAKLLELKAVRDDLGIGTDKWQDILAKRRVTTAKDLPDDELDKLLGVLKAKQDTRALEARAALGEPDDGKRLNPEPPY